MRRMAVARDEEVGKRDDDFRPRRSHLPSSTMMASFPVKWRRRRVMVVMGILLLIYVMHLYVPTGAWTAGQHTETYHPKPARTFQGYDAMKAKEPKGAPPRDVEAEEDEQSMHYYNGITKFYRLAGSLQRVARTSGTYTHNRNVLFAAASMRSLANIIPLACEMAKQEKNIAHFAVFGRSPLSLDDIQELNGIGEDCGIQWHDARGDYAEYSSDARMESATRGAMKHIQEYMHPQVVIVDDSSEEEAYFKKAMRKSTKEMDKGLIEIPHGKYEEFIWITKLSAASLAQWFQPTIDIVIQAPRRSSGRLIRLLQSLYNADYRGFKVPKINIELPPDAEPALLNYLNGFTWPPHKQSLLEPDMLAIHHRIPFGRMNSEQASLRFVESFYPARTFDNHVLLLSSQAEVSSNYYQYLHYAILNYRYAAAGFHTSEELLGISLDVPLITLNATNALQQPRLSKLEVAKHVKESEVDKNGLAPFLYQAPSSKATLVFGDSWATFHDFLTNRIQASHSGKAKKLAKLVAETEPAWMEYLLELMRARNLFVLHPSAPFVTIHNELAKIPEEFLRPKKGEDDSQAGHTSKAEDEPFILSSEPSVPLEQKEAQPERNQMPLHKMLPFEGELQLVSRLPVVTFDGEVSTSDALADVNEQYIIDFRKNIGGCSEEVASRPRRTKPLKTHDLFCLAGQAIEYRETGANERDSEEVATPLDLERGSAEDADADGSSIVSKGRIERTKSSENRIDDKI